MELNTFPVAFLIIGGLRIYAIDQETICIGRSQNNDLVLDYPQISRRHAEIQCVQGNYYISDLGSLGGTFVNGVKINQKRLEKGDVITIANLHLVFGQDEVPTSPATIPYKKPKESTISELETKSFDNDESKTLPDKKSGSY